MRYDEFPEWVIPRLADEIRACRFTPTVKTVKRWLAALGIPSYKEKASAIRTSALSYLKILEKEEVTDCTDLSISPKLACLYHDWTRKYGYGNDPTEALNVFLADFFSHEPPQNGEIESTNSNIADVTHSTSFPSPLNQTELAKRLGITNSLLSRHRSSNSFPRWSQLRDPEKIQWEWIPKIRRFYPKAQE